MQILVPALAVLVTATAIYVSRGVLDQVVTTDGLIRIAALPPWQSFAGFALAGLSGLLWLHHRRARRDDPSSSAFAGVLLPLLALALLVVPYLPVLPDVAPVLQTLAGPARMVVWTVVLTQFAWVLWQSQLLHVTWPALSLRRSSWVVGAVTLCISGTAAVRLAGTPIYPAGDEPHYLVMAQSLWRDGDLKIENNHQRGDYLEYFFRELEPHYVTRGADGEIYSIHPVGMPVLIAPVYAAGGYPAVVAAFALIASIAAAAMWRTVAVATGSARAATFAWAAVAATAPFLFNSFAVYPEIPAALSVAVGYALLRRTDRLWTWLAIGVVCGALPWLSTKYAPMAAALAAVALGRLLWRPSAAAESRDGSDALRAGALLGPFAVSLLAWFYFFYAFWGSPMPQAPYGALVQTEISNLLFGAPGLLFDQEYGLLPYAPVYALAGTGLWAMWRSDSVQRRSAIEIAAIFGALLATVGAFRIWWGGWAAPGRPLTSGLLLLMLPIAVAFNSAPTGTARRAAHHLLLWTSIAVAGMLNFAEGGFLLTNGRDGTSTLLEYLSPRWALWTLVPSFIQHEVFTALMHSMVWIALAAGTALIVRRAHARSPAGASLVAITATTGALLIAAAAMPLLPLTPRWPEATVAARARMPFLDTFDAGLRPIAFEYSPFRRVTPEALVTRGVLLLEPGVRLDPQPLRVLHNGRFALPAGTYRLELRWSGNRSGEHVGLQLGRTGDPWQTWSVEPRAGETWATEFFIPIDIPFVGLRGTPALEEVLGAARFVPVAVVNRADRPRLPEVTGASQSGGASVFHHDPNIFAEAEGFWVRGGRTTRVTLHRANAQADLVLRVHSGPIANELRIAHGAWHAATPLSPLQIQVIQVPNSRTDLTTLELSAADTFVPRERERSSSDPRPLGIWVEVVP